MEERVSRVKTCPVYSSVCLFIHLGTILGRSNASPQLRKSAAKCALIRLLLVRTLRCGRPFVLGCARYICCFWWCAISSPNREFRIEVDQVFHSSFDYVRAFDVACMPDMPLAKSKVWIFHLFHPRVRVLSQKKKKEKKSIELERVAFVESSIFDTNNLVCVVAW